MKLELDEIIDINKKIIFMDWFTNKKKIANSAERLCNFITYLSGKTRLVGPQYLSREYKSMSKKYGENKFDELLEELSELGTKKPFAEKLDMLVDVFNKCCEFKYKRIVCAESVNDYSSYPEKVVGRIPKKIMNIIDEEYLKYQEEDQKEYNKIIKEYNKALKSKDKTMPKIVTERESDGFCENLTK